MGTVGPGKPHPAGELQTQAHLTVPATVPRSHRLAPGSPHRPFRVEPGESWTPSAFKEYYFNSQPATPTVCWAHILCQAPSWVPYPTIDLHPNLF